MYHAWLSYQQAEVIRRQHEIDESKHTSRRPKTGIKYYGNSKSGKTGIAVSMISKNPTLEQVTIDAFPDLIYQGEVDTFEKAT